MEPCVMPEWIDSGSDVTPKHRDTLAAVRHVRMKPLKKVAPEAELAQLAQQTVVTDLVKGF